MMKNLSTLYKSIRKLFGLTSGRKLIVEALFLTGIIRFAVRFIPFRRLALLSGRYMEETPTDIDEASWRQAMAVGWAISVVSRHTPWQSKCLVQALAGQVMLKRRKIPATLYLGLAKDNDNHPLAHAWLRCGSQIITGDAARKGFVTVAKFANLDGG